jgi:AcrR family transcriptional regulator
MAAAETPTMMMDRLSDAVWQMLAEQSPRAIHIDDVADAAGVAPAAARAVAGSIMALILHKLQRLDRQAVLETLADIEDAGDVSVRDKIIEALTHRFEIYAPYRRQVAQLDTAARRDPALGLRLIDSLVQAMRMLLRMAGDDLAGWQGEARVRGVAGVAMVVARIWQDDDTPDLATTMKEIDRRLATAEEWGRTLRVLGGGASQDSGGDDDTGSYDEPLDQAPGGRYQ